MDSQALTGFSRFTGTSIGLLTGNRGPAAVISFPLFLRRWCIPSVAALTMVFSFFLPLRAGERGSRLLIENFHPCGEPATNIPCNWFQNRKDVSMFTLPRENDNYFLRVATSGGCTTIGRGYAYSTARYPLLSWRWRVYKLPEGGNEYRRETNDSGAGVYVVFKGNLKLNHVLKYVWSTTLPVGTTTPSPFNPRTKFIVLQSGISRAGAWVRETVNVYDDYRRLFGREPPAVEAIAILTDADNTRSTATADYDDFAISGPVKVSRR